MVANGLLTNPTLFSGSSRTTLDCVQTWVDICYNSTLTFEQFKNTKLVLGIPEKPNNLTFQCFHHHLVFMLEKLLSRVEKKIFNNLQSFQSVLSFLKSQFDITPQLFGKSRFLETCPLDLDYTNLDRMYLDLKPSSDKKIDFVDTFYDPDDNKGKYFTNKLKEDVSCDWSDLFLEKQ